MIKWVALAGMVLLLGLTVAGCAETPQQRAQRIEPMLAAAGFRMRAANTPDRADDLKSRTQLRVRYTTHGNQVHYWFADAAFCQCLYFGTQADYQRYERLRLQEQLADREQAAASMNEDAAMQDQMMDFNMWPMY